MKKCSKCKDVKPISEFYALRARNGYQARCKNCAKAGAIEWLKANPEKAIANELRYRIAHRKEKAEKTAQWYYDNKNRNHENAARWYRNNPHRGREKTAAYRAAQAKATTTWANEFFIVEAYHLAQLRTRVFGFAWHVDHIVPMKSKLVCGLHCEHNLQVIPGNSNSAKGNRIWPDMP